jgi:hypothetical protein
MWEFNDTKALPSDLVREQDFILKLRRLHRIGTPHVIINLSMNAIAALGNASSVESIEDALRELVRTTDGTYADMSNSDAFIAWETRADPQTLVKKIIAALPPEITKGHDFDHLLRVYTMPGDYIKIRERANEYVTMIQAAQATASSTESPSQALHSEAARGPLTAWSVDQIGRLIADIDMKPYMRAQPIYRHASDRSWHPVRTEIYVSFDDLRRERFPKLDIVTPEHLFLSLCETIDKRLLHQFTAKPDMLTGQSVNLNLSVATIVGATFTQFTHVIPSAKRKQIAFELHRGDLLQDFARTLGAIETLKKEGFQVALDGITPDILTYLNIAAFNAEFVKINVARDRAATLADPAVRKALATIPPERLVFYRCDSETSFKMGQDLGVSLFQGWLIDDKVRGKR